MSYAPHQKRQGINSSIRWIFLPAVGALTANDPEKAHEIAVMAIGSGFAPKDKGIDDERLSIEVRSLCSY